MQNQEENQLSQPKQRTKKQNNAFHLWCSELSRESNNHGITQRVIMERIEVDWTPEAVKSLVKHIAKVKYGTDKTSELTTTQLSDCCEEISKIFSEKGAYVRFPSEEELEFNKYYS